VPSDRQYDLILVGGGIMSATLAVLLRQANPELKMLVLERLDAVSLESSNAWNNAGTGHAALCELNYMPDDPAGNLPSVDKAVSINQQFQESREFWSSLVKDGVLGDPATFIHSVPHMTFVQGAKDVDYLERRYKALMDQPLFAGMEFSKDFEQIAKWAPIMIEGRRQSEVAATRIEQGTDVDYGQLTEQLFAWLVTKGVEVLTGHEVRSLRNSNGIWQVTGKGNESDFDFSSPRVFVGAGGWALRLLQKAKIKEINGYGTFPVSGHFFKTENPELVARHQAKVYSQAAVGAPPMSVPHLDTRVIDGKTSLLFGPFAGLNLKFLKNGSWLDLPASIRLGNIISYLSVALKNFTLVVYLVKEIFKSSKQKIESLREFVPNARAEDWELYEAGQRAQVIKPVNGLGVLQFGTEVISSADGSIAGLLGASPGASVATSVMLDVATRLFPGSQNPWMKDIANSVPSYGLKLNDYPSKARESLSMTAATLKLKA
jgi:malate dehydrogenase (quinone)